MTTKAAVSPLARQIADIIRGGEVLADSGDKDMDHAWHDEDGDGKCDTCGMTEEEHAAAAEASASAAAETAVLAKNPPHEFTDDDGDGKCDVCGAPEEFHSDEAKASALDEIRARLAAGFSVIMGLDGMLLPRGHEPLTVSALEPALDNVLLQALIAAAVAEVKDPVVIDPANPGRFRATLVVEDERTADNRLIAKGATAWRTPPLPLMLMTRTDLGHDGSVVCAVIEKITRAGNKILGEGRFDTGEAGVEAARLVANGVLTGVSIDGGDAEREMIVEAEDDDGFPTKVLERMSALTILGACYDDQTEVLTDQGWTTFDRITPDHRMATRHPETHEFEWQHPTYFHRDDWDGDMVRISSQRGVDLLVTPNHRMLVWDSYRKTERIVRADFLVGRTNQKRYAFPKTVEWSRPDMESFHLDGLTRAAQAAKVEWSGDDYAAFMGAWLAEGCIDYDRGRVYLSQRESSKGYVEYAALWDRLFGDTRSGKARSSHDGNAFVVKRRNLADYLAQFGKAADKFIPADVLEGLSARQLRIFLHFYLLGDGHMAPGVWKGYTSSPFLRDGLMEAAAKAGMWAVYHERNKAPKTIEGRVIPIERQQDSWVVTFRNLPDRPSRARRELVRTYDAEIVHHEGVVRCVSVPNEILYVRRNGIPTWCGNTIVPFPAIGSTLIEWIPPASADEKAAAADETLDCEDCRGEIDVDALTAGGPIAFPKEMFAVPEFTEPTPLRVTADGQVSGHAALWKQCHTSFAGLCVTPPRSKTGYSHFLLKSLLLEGGGYQAVGTITLSTKHADKKLDHREAEMHYDHSGSAVAYVNVGEDEHGIWVAGVLKPGVSDELATELCGASLSGDWRRIGGNLELIAILGVNVPGFPIAHARGEEQMSLVAAGYGPTRPTRSITDAEHDSDARLARVEAELAEARATLAKLAEQMAPIVRERLAKRITEQI